MIEVEVVEKPNLVGKRRALVLAEDRVGHYPEFREFFIRRLISMAGRSPAISARPLE